MELLDSAPKEPAKEKPSLAKRLTPAKRKGAPGQEEGEQVELAEAAAPAPAAAAPSTVAKSGFAKRRRVGPPAEPEVSNADGKPDGEGNETEKAAAVPAVRKAAKVVKKEDGVIAKDTDASTPTVDPTPPATPAAPSIAVSASPPSPSPLTPPLRRSTVIDATARPVEDLPDPTPALRVMSAEAARKFLPYSNLCDEYAMLLVHSMNLAQQPESLTRQQIDSIVAKAGEQPVWTLTKQTRSMAGSSFQERSFGFTWYPPHRETPKSIERLSVVSSDCALRVLARSESIPVDVEHSNDMLSPFVVAWWRTFAQANSRSTLVEPMCVILGGSETRQSHHFSTLITRDGLYYQHHNSFPMGTAGQSLSDPADRLARDFLASAQRIVADLTLGHEKTRARLRELNIPYITDVLQSHNRPALESLMAKARFFVTYDLDRKRLGSSQIPHESLIQKPDSGDCLLHCIERIAFCMADGGNNISCTGGPSLQKRETTVKRMRECCVRWWKLKWEAEEQKDGVGKS